VAGYNHSALLKALPTIPMAAAAALLIVVILQVSRWQETWVRAVPGPATDAAPATGS
jgi:hypothetical protein